MLEKPDEIKIRVGGGTTSRSAGVYDQIRQMAWADPASEEALDRVSRNAGDDLALGTAGVVGQLRFEEPGLRFRVTHVLLEAGKNRQAREGEKEDRPVPAVNDLSWLKSQSAGVGSAEGIFAGHEQELSKAVNLLERDRDGVLVLNVTGCAGAGKTEFAKKIAECASQDVTRCVHLETRLSIDGGAHTRKVPRDAFDVLGEFLLGLGVPQAEILPTFAERRARYLEKLAGRRPVIVMDNALDASQVVPLLPMRDGTVIVTSRAELRGLPGAVHMPMTPLTLESALALMGERMGVDRIERDPDNARHIIRLCEGIPQAVDIVSRWLATAEEVALAAVVTGLREARRRPAVGTEENRAVMAAFNFVYGMLNTAQRDVLKAAGLAAMTETDVRAICVGTGLPADEVVPAIEHLVGIGLMRTADQAASRLRMPSAIANLAKEKATEEFSAEQQARTIDSMAWLQAWRCRGLTELLQCPVIESQPLVRLWAQACRKTARAASVSLLRSAMAVLREAAAHTVAAHVIELFPDSEELPDIQASLEPVLDAARAAGDRDLECRALLLLGADAKRQAQDVRALSLLDAAESIAAEIENQILLLDVERVRDGRRPYKHPTTPTEESREHLIPEGSGLARAWAANESAWGLSSAPQGPARFGISAGRQ